MSDRRAEGGLLKTPGNWANWKYWILAVLLRMGNGCAAGVGWWFPV